MATTPDSGSWNSGLSSALHGSDTSGSQASPNGQQPCSFVRPTQVKEFVVVSRLSAVMGSLSPEKKAKASALLGKTVNCKPAEDFFKDNFPGVRVPATLVDQVIGELDVTYPDPPLMTCRSRVTRVVRPFARWQPAASCSCPSPTAQRAATSPAGWTCRRPLLRVCVVAVAGNSDALPMCRASSASAGSRARARRTACTSTATSSRPSSSRCSTRAPCAISRAKTSTTSSPTSRTVAPRRLRVAATVGQRSGAPAAAGCPAALLHIVALPGL